MYTIMNTENNLDIILPKNESVDIPENQSVDIPENPSVDIIDKSSKNYFYIHTTK